jgi:predicted O-methyltransferase YrrM
VSLLSSQTLTVMRELEELDAKDRTDGTPFFERLRSVTPEIGRFLEILVLATHAQTVVECGTSGGYSTLWLASAARANGGRVVTFEIAPAKIERAQKTFVDAGLSDVIELHHEDVLVGLTRFTESADLVFIDHEKALYEQLLEPAVRALRPGGLLIADNLTSSESALAGFREAALAHPELATQVVPIGKGELIAVKHPPEVFR